MTNDKADATYHAPLGDAPTDPAKNKPKRKIITLPGVVTAVVFLLLVAALALNMVHDNNIITARDHTISQQKKVIASDKSKIAALSQQVQSETDRANSCAAARDEWKKTTADFSTATGDLLSNLFTPDYDSTHTYDQATQDADQAKALDEKCTTGVQS